MNRKNRVPFSTNPYERKILKIVFLSAIFPVLIVIGFFYCLFSDLIYTYLNSTMADHSLYQFFILSIIILLYYFLFLSIIAYYFVHKLVGVFPRIFRELDEKIAGKSRSPIYVRKGDYVKGLTGRINSLLDKLSN